MDTDKTQHEPQDDTQVMIQFTVSVGGIRVSRKMPMRKCHAFSMPRIVGGLLEQLTEKCTHKASLLKKTALAKGSME